MRRMLIDSIKGNELLARDIVSSGGIVIMATGSIVKKDYIKKLLELDIDYI